MSSEYNSKLIVQLIQSTDTEIIKKILEEIEDIGDPIFIYPIFEKWKTLARDSFYISHYFISALLTINSEEVLKIALEMITMPRRSIDYAYIYQIFTKFRYSSDQIINDAIDQVRLISENPEKAIIKYEYDLSYILDYLKLMKRIDTISKFLERIVLNEHLKDDFRKTALYYLLRIDPNLEIQYFIDNYDKNRSDSLDLLLTRELLQWKGKLVGTLLDIIKQKGLVRAKELILAKEKKDIKEQHEEKKAETIKFSNIQLIVEIHDKKAKINSLTIANNEIGLAIFTESESLIKQQEIVTNLESFMTKCAELRSIFKGIAQNVKNPYTEEVALKKLTNQTKENLNKPLNRLTLFLMSKGYRIDHNLYGLRSLNALVNLVTHPELEKDLIKVLRELGVYNQYKDKKWEELHREILKKYLISLQKLFELLSNES